jgi:hypothetical protein
LSTFFFADDRNKTANHAHIPEIGFQSLFQGPAILMLIRNGACAREKIKLQIM